MSNRLWRVGRRTFLRLLRLAEALQVRRPEQIDLQALHRVRRLAREK
jgi:hypothetical protein